MSDLLNTIKSASLTARKEKDTVKAGVLGMVLTDVLNITKAPGWKGGEVSDVDVSNVIKSWVKKTRDSIEMTEKGHGDTSKLTTELNILEVYLPTQLSVEDIELKVKEAVVSGKNTMKDLMGYFKENFAGLYDGKVLSDIVKKHLI